MKAVIFDMDGVLIDSEPFWREAEIEAFRDVGVMLTGDDCASTKGWRIDQVVDYWRSRRPWQGVANEVVRDAIIAGVVERVLTRGVPLAGVHASIATIREAGLQLALATSSSMVLVDAVLPRLKLEGAFEVVCSAQDDPHGKPHPQVFLRTAERLGVDPTEVTVIEDSVAGMVAAKAARMRCIVVPEASEADFPHWGLADHKLDDLTAFSLALVR